jgi:parallel beta-helix repeat protein
MKIGGSLGFLSFFIVSGFLQTPAWGKNCGGAVSCVCNDTVIEDYALPADLGPCPGNGLNIGDDVELDGQNHQIIGSQLNNTFGIIFRGQRSTVKNVKTTKFARCIRFRGVDSPPRPAQDNVIEDSELVDCGFLTGTPPRPATNGSYGVDFAAGAIANEVRDNVIRGAFDEGVHFGSGTEGNRVSNNLIENSGVESVYILNTSGNTVTDNTITGGSVSIFVDGASNNEVQDNVGDRLLQVRAGAADNIFQDNTFRSVRFEQNATRNEVTGGQINGGNPCIQFRTGATGNVLQDVELMNCVSDVDARESGTNTLIAVMSLRFDKISVQNQASVIVCDEGPTNCQEFIAPRVVTMLTPAKVWVGLKNSDDQGTQFDVRAELYRQNVLIAVGETLCVTEVTNNPTKAKEVVIPFGALSNATFDRVGSLSLRILTRIGTTEDGKKCSGPGGSHGSAVGLKLYYDAVNRAEKFGAEITPAPLRDYFAHTNSSDFLDAIAPTANVAKQKASGGVNFNAGNPWQEIGRWSMIVNVTNP